MYFYEGPDAATAYFLEFCKSFHIDTLFADRIYDSDFLESEFLIYWNGFSSVPSRK